MKFARGLAVITLISASLPLAIACGSANNDLFSPSGAAGNTNKAGAGNSEAGTSAGGALGHAGGAGAGAGADPGSNGGDGEAGDMNVGGSSGAPSGGMSGGGEGGSMAGAGGEVAGAGGAAAGAGGSVAGAGGAMAGAGGATAGAGGTGGASGGASGIGGAAGASTCPPTAPATNQLCLVQTPNSCFYAGEACSCLASNGGGPVGPRKWGCYGTPDKCPDAKPTAGVACKQNVGAECPYPNSDFCACVGNNNDAKWVCQLPQATCSPAKPAEGAACQTVRTCQYADVACFCNGANWGCEGG